MDIEVSRPWVFHGFVVAFLAIVDPIVENISSRCPRCPTNGSDLFEFGKGLPRGRASL